MQAYSRMFQQEASRKYQKRFYASTLICEHKSLSLPAPGHMFKALEVPQKPPQIDLADLKQIIHLAASTMDLNVVREDKDVGKRMNKTLNNLVQDSAAALKALQIR